MNDLENAVPGRKKAEGEKEPEKTSEEVKNHADETETSDTDLLLRFIDEQIEKKSKKPVSGKKKIQPYYAKKEKPAPKPTPEESRFGSIDKLLNDLDREALTPATYSAQVPSPAQETAAAEKKAEAKQPEQEEQPAPVVVEKPSPQPETPTPAAQPKAAEKVEQAETASPRPEAQPTPAAPEKTAAISSTPDKQQAATVQPPKQPDNVKTAAPPVQTAAEQTTKTEEKPSGKVEKKTDEKEDKKDKDVQLSGYKYIKFRTASSSGNKHEYLATEGLTNKTGRFEQATNLSLTANIGQKTKVKGTFNEMPQQEKSMLVGITQGFYGATYGDFSADVKGGRFAPLSKSITGVE
ncbi:MAG TPA: hypothetical protein PLQ76_01940, partial [bacterium]|nr:hypothetical protein [bacterium]